MRLIASEILVFITGLFFLILAVFMIKQSNLKLEDLHKYTGVVVEKGITIKRSPGRGLDSKVFYLKLSGLNETLAVYKFSKDYRNFITNIQKGDKITVYFKPHSNRSQLNLDLFQIENSFTTIWALSNSTPRYLGLGIFILLISLPLFTLGFLLDKLRRNGSVQLWRIKRNKK